MLSYLYLLRALTILRALRTFNILRALRAFVICTCLRCIHFLLALRVPIFLCTFIFYVVSIFLHGLRVLFFLHALLAFTFLLFLLAFTSLSVSGFDVAYLHSFFLYKMWNNLQPTITSWNRQERCRINQKQSKQAQTIPGNIAEILLTKYPYEFFFSYALLQKILTLTKFLIPDNWHCGVVDIATAQFHSTKPELRFCVGCNPACSMSEIRDCEDLWQWSRLEIRLNAFCRSTIPQKQFNSIHNVRLFQIVRCSLQH